MPLHIVWQAVTDGEESILSVPLLGAELKLTMVGEIITDASWHVGCQLTNVLSPQAARVQSYLLNPLRTELHVTLLSHGSAYANAVWSALLAIPIGRVETYSGLAEKLGSGPRAIARACRNNPYAGIIPCHRVVAKNGIGGFMGQADGEFVALKRRLLEHERGLELTVE
ncbi:Methylated-DNA--protein-cysteine methyltransferase (EC 2.1.1.63) [Methylomonas albis]|uniref:MGMT family protein n=1 Tax=Methylomonas albis TaxID=1854563 RepID=A0ABR9CX51_9GAMM|nr:MGMT family protein [Methylomonas albis]MBD9355086.1 MGMT family protein [Methylomonas albis]CAD6878011.1 Methylated-DNA--protein-cysteine methyltransferase (EC 2.1.1.63) [Methylomonas albis]